MYSGNYATLEQVKKMKELGYPQEKTDCIWAVRMGVHILYTRDELNWRDGVPVIEDDDGDPIVWFEDWWAAPNAQEIELSIFNGGFRCLPHQDMFYLSCSEYKNFSFGQVHHAQARADAWIWEKKDTNEI